MIVLTLLTVGFIFFSYQIVNKSKVDTSARNKTTPLALINYVPNFETLSLNDLPNFVDYRQSYPYNNNLLIIGYNKIVEYDQNNKKIIRLNDTKVFNCINQSALIGTDLYVSCYISQKFPNNSSFPYSVLYKLDLINGRVVKTYFDEIPPLPSPLDAIRTENNLHGRKVNMYLASQDSILWMSSWDGVVRMDTKTNQMKTYSIQNIFNNSRCFPSGIFNDQGNITVLAGGFADCDGSISIYNSKDDRWEDITINYEEYSKKWKLYKDSNKLSVTFPTFLSISPIINEMYYLLASDGVYSLVSREFPKKIIESPVSIQSDIKSYISEDKRFILFIGEVGRGPTFEVPLVQSVLDAYLIDLQKLTITNLMKADEFNTKTNEKIDNIISKIGSAYKEEKNGVLYFKDSKNNQTLITINLLKAKLTIGD